MYLEAVCYMVHNIRTTQHILTYTHPYWYDT